MPVTQDASQRNMSAIARIGRSGCSESSVLSCGGDRSTDAHAAWKRSCMSPPNHSSATHSQASRATEFTAFAITDQPTLFVSAAQSLSLVKKMVDFTQRLARGWNV